MGDITGQEFLEEETEKLSKQKDLMIKEMKHRMANSLQLIASILILKSEAVESPEVRTHLKDAHERILSIATVEKFLDTTSLNEEVEVGPYLTGLCESLSASMIGSNKPIELKVSSEGGMVTSSVGISLGLITAELVINALKHAFPNGKSGKVVVAYQTYKGGWRLIVSDNGMGVKVDPLRKEGLGTTIVQSLARQLGAAVEMRTSSQGTTVSIDYASKTI
jgi:chemotaxis protein methyltransferase CheR